VLALAYAYEQASEWHRRKPTLPSWCSSRRQRESISLTEADKARYRIIVVKAVESAEVSAEFRAKPCTHLPQLGW